MKILQVISSLEMGGAEQLVVDISSALQQKGHQVDIAICKSTNSILEKKIKKTGCRVIILGNHVYSPLCLLRLLKITKNYDIIHSHNFSPQLFCAITSFFQKGIFITTEHNTYNRRRKYKWYKCFDRWMYNQYNHTICITKKTLDNLLNYIQFSSTKFSIIKNGIDVEKFHQAKSLPKTSNKIILVNVAGFRKQKDQDTLIRTMALLPSEKFELWLVGDGERRQELESLISQLNLKNTVKLLGIREDIPNILQTADIVIMSSHYEGLSLSSIEGMSVEKPFIASKVPGLEEIVEGAGILFSHQNSTELSRIITQLVEDKEYYSSIAQSCYQRAKDFDISKTIAQYEELYLKSTTRFKL